MPIEQFFRVMLMAAVATVVAVATLTAVSMPGDPADSDLDSRSALAAAYGRVTPGLTRASELQDLGFDTTKPNARTLSYLGLMERIASHGTSVVDRMDRQVRDCLAMPGICKAVVFQPDGQHAQPSLFAAEAETGSQVMLLIERGRVAYKTISGPGVAPSQVVAAPASPLRASSAD